MHEWLSDGEDDSGSLPSAATPHQSHPAILQAPPSLAFRYLPSTNRFQTSVAFLAPTDPSTSSSSSSSSLTLPPTSWSFWPTPSPTFVLAAQSPAPSSFLRGAAAPASNAALSQAGEVSARSFPFGVSSTAAMLVGAVTILGRNLRSKRRLPPTSQARFSRCQTSFNYERRPLATFALPNESEVPQAPTPQSADQAPKPRVRFAPSPTGVLHVGGARTALFNWLFARSLGGEMILRIEDTDTARSTSESEAAILEGLKWCGITWTEGPDVGGPHWPYRQTERIEAGIYAKELEKLEAADKVYKCFLTAQELDQMRADAELRGQAFVVKSPWATASKEEVQEMLDQGKPFVYRFRVPVNQIMELDDMVLGNVKWNSNDLGGDFVIVRQNGVPMYNFGVVVDDALMGITHVFRAQEHLMNTPRQVLLYEALNYPQPRFGHMPLILSTDRSKLSKRHGAVAVGDYQKQGYLPSGMINYLAQLGWNDGTNKEIYATDELAEAFQMERMSKVAAIFDVEKLKWVNRQHIKALSPEEASNMIGEELVKAGIVKEAKGEFVQRAAHLLQDRISTLVDAPDELRSILEYDLHGMWENKEYRQWVQDGSVVDTAKHILDAEAAGLVGDLGEDEDLKKLVTYVQGKRGVKKKALLVPIRLCLTGSNSGPNMRTFFQMLAAADDNVLLDVMSLKDRLHLLRSKFQEHF